MSLGLKSAKCCRLESLAAGKHLNLQHLDVAAFANHLLPEKLPAFKAAEVAWHSISSDSEPSEEWLRLLWKKLEVGNVSLAVCWLLPQFVTELQISLQRLSIHSKVIAGPEARIHKICHACRLSASSRSSMDGRSYPQMKGS